jgi:hypothetical protein
MPNTDDFPHALPANWQVKLSKRNNKDGSHGSALWVMPPAPFNRPPLMPTIPFRLRQAWPTDDQLAQILEWYATKSPFSIRCATVPDGVMLFLSFADNMDEEAFFHARRAAREFGRAS